MSRSPFWKKSYKRSLVTRFKILTIVLLLLVCLLAADMFAVILSAHESHLIKWLSVFLNEELLASAVEKTQTLLLPLFVGMLIVQAVYIVVGNFLFRRLILTPLERLTKSVAETRSGAQAIYGAERDDEIGTLARSIENAMLSGDRQTELLKAINDAASIMLAAEDEESFKDPLMQGMELMGNFISADRVNVWQREFINGEECYLNRSMWVSGLGALATAPAENHVFFHRDFPPAWKEMLMEKHPVSGPLKNFSREERDFLKPYEIKSILLFPVHLNGRLWGIISADDCRRERFFSSDEVNVLYSAGLMMVNAYNRNMNAAKIRSVSARTKLLLEAMPLSCTLVNRKKEVVMYNGATSRLFKFAGNKPGSYDLLKFSPPFQPDGRSSREAAREYITRAFGEGDCSFDWLHQDTEGVPIQTEVTLVRVVDEDDYVVAAYVRDMREQVQMLNEIEQRDNLLYTVNQTATVLLHTESGQFGDTLHRCMGLLSQAVDAGRMNIWKNSVENGVLCCAQIYAWPGSEPDMTASRPYEDEFPSWVERLSRGLCINGLTSGMPRKERENLTVRGILSVLAVPVFLRGSFWGFVSFVDYKKERIFTSNEESILLSASIQIANALLRNDMLLYVQATAANLKTVIENYSGLIFSVDNDMTLTSVNGLSVKFFAEEFPFREGDNIGGLPGVGMSADIFGIVERTFAEGTQDSVREVNGKVIRMRSSLILDDNGRMIGMVGSMDDITDRSRLQSALESALQQAQEASRAKSNFLASMSHEIRTPMNAIIGMTGIGKASGDAGRMMYCLTRIGDASAHLLGVINDILDMSKIEANKLELSPSEFHFEKMLQRTVNMINFRVDEKRQKLSVSADKNISGYFVGDAQRIAQVITNLAGNAVKFTPEGGSIVIAASLESEKREENECVVKVTVTDSGIGISKEQQARLFQSFIQADSTTTRKYGGTGLGLAISKRIVEMMGGTIWIESELGHGATFGFTVPLKSVPFSEENTEENARNPQQTPEDPVFPGRRILLAEDVEINREIVVSMLEATLLEIDCAQNGAEAVQMFAAAPDRYDMIFMDLQMPEMDGYEATKAIRALGVPNAKEVPVIAMTANVFREDIENCLAAGMNGHMGKPLSMEEIMEKLREYLI